MKKIRGSFHFRKRVRLHKLLAVNLSKTGVSLSVGRRGLTFNFGRRGVFVTLSAPGSGLSYRAHVPFVRDVAQWVLQKMARRADTDLLKADKTKEDDEGAEKWISSTK